MSSLHCTVTLRSSQIVLAGDPMQLGPVLRSKMAAELGLQQSLLERLIKLPLYERNETKYADHGCYDPLLVTKLVENYRSHPAIIAPYSALFYHSELVASGDRALIQSMCTWSELPNQHDFPVIFHGVRVGSQRRLTVKQLAMLTGVVAVSVTSRCCCCRATRFVRATTRRGSTRPRRCSSLSICSSSSTIRNYPAYSPPTSASSRHTENRCEG